jgi:NAD(P)-dependent dehydrogenase (short-subunit alcohol dehydrogenase family)
MQPVSSSPYSLRQIASALLIGSAALLILGVQPILLGELVTLHIITMEGVGIIAMGEIVTLGLGVALGDALLPLSRYRTITAIAALLAAFLDIATCFAAGDNQMIVLRAAAGLAEGVLVWVATTVVVRSFKPDRLAAIFMVVQTLAQTSIAAMLAVWVVPVGGWKGGFLVLGLLTAFTALLALSLPTGLKPLTPPTDTKFKWSAFAALPLAIAFLQMAALGSLWAYLEPIGLDRGFDAQGVQTVISEVLFMQMVGGTLAIWLVRRLGIAITLLTGGVVLAAISGSIYLLPKGAHLEFTLLCVVFGFAWLFLMPFHVALAFRADAKGRVAVLVPAAQLLGSAFGPLIASLVVTGDDATPVPIVSLCFAMSMVALLLFARKRWMHSEPLPEESFSGKVVLVAGASSGMGRAFALRLAGEGARIVVTARRKERLDTLAAEIERRGGRCLALAADAQNPDDAARVVTASVETFGRIDLALLNVGGAPAIDMRKMDASEVTAYMRSNYDTVVNYLFPILEQMRKQQDGIVAHTNSLAGFLGVPLQGPYSAAKGALRLLFDTCRIEFAPYGIRFVSIYPGFVATEATANDGMPAPLEISEETAVDHIVFALRHERSDYMFPWTLRWLVRLAAVLPKPITNWILHFEVPSLRE